MKSELGILKYFEVILMTEIKINYQNINSTTLTYSILYRIEYSMCQSQRTVEEFTFLLF